MKIMTNKAASIILCCVLALVAWSSLAAVNPAREEERRARQLERQNQRAQKRAELDRIKEERQAEQKRKHEEALAAAELKREQQRAARELAAQEEAQRKLEREEQRQKEQAEREEQRRKEQAEREAREAERKAQREEADRISNKNAIPARVITSLCFVVWVAGIIILFIKVEPQRYSSDNVFCPKCGSPGVLLSDIHSDGISYGSAKSVDYSNDININTTSKHQTGASRRAAPPLRFLWPLSAVGFWLIWSGAYYYPVACCIWPLLLVAAALVCFAQERKTNTYGRWCATRKCQGCGNLFYSAE